MRDNSPGRIVHRSAELSVRTVASEDIRSVIDDIGQRVGDAGVRYYLSGGAGPFERAVWRFGRRDLAGPPTDLSIVQDMVGYREQHAAAVERELRAVRSWFDEADGAPRVLVLEALGAPSRDDIAFWQACRLRLTRDGRQSMVVLRHEMPDGRAEPTGRPAEEILLVLRLAGGYAWAAEFERWSRSRGWEPGLVAALTSARETEHGTLYTYAGAQQSARAASAYRAAEPGVVQDLAALVVSGQAEPSLATAALLGDPTTALWAFSTAGAAESVNHRRRLSRYAGNMFRRGRAQGWAGISSSTASVAYLAAIVAERRHISAAAADVLLAQAERRGVEPRARAMLAYRLGDLLVKDSAPTSRAAGVRCFDYVRSCRTAAPTEPESDRSQIAASHNGAALASYRDKDLDAAAATMLAGLDALNGSGVLDNDDLCRQRILLTANLAKVYRRDEATRREALAAYRDAWRTAVRAESLPGAVYVAGDLVRALIEAGERDEAESAVRELLRQYDLAADPERASERAVAAVCWHLADVNLSAGAVRTAADWYIAAVQRMRRGGPEVIDAIIRNLRQLSPVLSEEVLGYLERERAAHAVLAEDCTALASGAS